ncbi:hypothetical protein MTO98_15695 [Mucilaginibacter sp. SMC90]|uniref:hypothetical protein n=1 Tax=Mucilaginibacter sp. SMC90 TaxID=2929803 RepID=UPI001FB3CCC5|nr:hypothetical protein [Mucilaginibacter sp. SMC90]UOE52519.1 hypothetical protein MTO98_15695 [Mucilaginibacter sp. SMC90]
MTLQLSFPKTYYVVCYIVFSEHLTMLSFDNYFNWLSLQPASLMDSTITTIYLN